MQAPLHAKNLQFSYKVSEDNFFHVIVKKINKYN